MISIKNIMLLNKPLSNFELEDAAKKLKNSYFRGVFLLDTLPRKPSNKECGIVNFDKAMVLTHIGSLGIKTVKLKSTLIVTACNLHQKLLSTWEVQYIITPIKFNQRGKYSVVICVYPFSKNLAWVMNSKTF